MEIRNEHRFQRANFGGGHYKIAYTEENEEVFAILDWLHTLKYDGDPIWDYQFLPEGLLIWFKHEIDLTAFLLRWA